MKKHLLTFAVGAGVVFGAAKASEYLNKPGTDGKKPLGDEVAKYAAPLAGGVALVLAHHFLSGI
jgi:hypothetical protein